jgi:purine-nucleoside phosphorylase
MKSMDEYVNNVNATVKFLQEKFGDFHPQVAITLGSGLSKLASLIEPIVEIPYSQIPYFHQTSVPGHEGILIAGTLEGVPLIGFKGRKHYYEVANDPDGMDKVVFPVHVAASLGCRLYIATNAAGGLNPNFFVGELMVIRSHLDLFIKNPLLGPHHDFGGNLYFQPQNNIYDQDLNAVFRDGRTAIHEGVYACVTGRTYETSADCMALRILGVDAVGMSTVPEVIVAANRGMKTMGISTITNIIAADGTNATNHEEVTAILNSPETEARLFSFYQNFFQKIKADYAA